MKHLILSVVSALALLPVSLASAHPTDPAPSDEAAIPRVLQNTTNVRLSPSPIPGLQQVTAGRNVFYITEDGKHVLIGHILSGDDGTDLTAQAEQDALKPFFAKLMQDAPVKFGTGPHQVLAFLDPDCQFCRRVWPSLKALKNVEVGVHLMGSPVALAPIVCHDQPFEQLDAYFTSGPKPGLLCDKIKDVLRLSQLAQIEGTPTFLSETLEWKKGLQTTEALQEWLAPLTTP